MILNGDCLERLKEIADQSVDMVLADLPYGTTACKWDNVIPFEPLWKELHRVCKSNAAMCMFGSEPFSSHMRMSNIKSFRYDWVWDKKVSGSFVQCKVMPLRTHEMISVFCTGKKNPKYTPQMTFCEKIRRHGATNNFKTRTGSIPIKGDDSALKAKIYKDKFPVTPIYFSPRADKSRGLHPTQKPVALLEYLIKTYTQPGDTVLDPTMGSGSTGVACKNLGREFIGIEMDAGYFEIANHRIASHEPSR